MPVTKEEARQEVAKLIDYYQALGEGKIRTFTEADTRRVFVLPLFHALGWDVYSREEVAEEVKAASGRVDYVFRLHGVAQFYLEAKALRADLTKPEYVRQAITYAYNKGITWAVLSDFEGLQVYNAQTGRSFITLSYDNYLRDFDDLWLLSKESLENNTLNERAEKYGALPPRLGIEQRLYNQLWQWREGLFTQLHHYNHSLSFSQIDEVIQRLFNRLIFIRTCEDRGIENKALLSAVHEWRRIGRKGEFVETLRAIFRYFDGYYDSDLFRHHLTDEVFIESATIENIFNSLYEIPGGMASYDFSLIDADVLGAVYEQYLGHVATVAKQQAREARARMDLGLPSEPIIELIAKKQRRKEHGIYYTPKFVTNYIVKETVGRFLKERSHNEIFNIKILDPACGSGSFLIRAYDELLNYHAYQRGKPVSELDQYERLPILTNNIFGVDLDIQAVEIARLNLLLRSLAKRETLPTLADYIRQGNSLISGTEEELKKYFGDNWQDKKPFNWEQEFKDVMADGGFDVVIGNPPYLFGEYIESSEKEYIKAKYLVAQGQYDAFWLFYERCLYLVKEDGYHGFIVPDAILVRDESEVLRKMLLQNTRIKKIAHVGQVFQGSGVSAVIIIVQKNIKDLQDNVIDIEKVDENGATLINQVKQDDFLRHKKHAFIISLTPAWDIIRHKLLTNSLQLRTLVSLSRGEEFGKKTLSRQLGSVPKGKVEILVGEDVTRYLITEPKHLIDKISIVKPEDNYKSPKIVIVKTGKSLICALDTRNRYTLQSLYNLQPKKDCRFHLNCMLSVLNSTLMSVYLQREVTSYKRLFPQINQSHILALPIRRIDFDNPGDKKRHDALVALVDRMLELNKRLAPIRHTYSNERDELLRQIERTDKEIDNLVYDLYGLTEEERKIVEGG